ncbi:unnamed protein product, partial [Medioppia subpectinata]
MKIIEMDVKKLLSAFLCDAINSFAFSIKTNALKDPNQPLVEFGRKVLAVEFNTALVLSIFLPKVAKLLRVTPFPADAIQYFKQLTEKLVAERREENSKQSLSQFLSHTKPIETKRKDFLQIMIDANKDTAEEEELITDHNTSDGVFERADDRQNASNPTAGRQTLSTVEMTAQCMLFFIAGFDTTGSAISHTLYYLSKYPEIQQKLYEELRDVTDFSADTLAALPYLNAVIQESVRLRPPILRVERVCNEDITLHNIHIPEGTICTVATYALHRDSRYWSDARTFRPERFVGSKPAHPYALMPFGAGPRVCLGMRFALIEIRLCLAKLVPRFRFTLCENTVVCILL